MIITSKWQLGNGRKCYCNLCISVPNVFFSTEGKHYSLTATRLIISTCITCRILNVASSASDLLKVFGSPTTPIVSAKRFTLSGERRVNRVSSGGFVVIVFRAPELRKIPKWLWINQIYPPCWTTVLGKLERDNFNPQEAQAGRSSKQVVVMKK